MILTQKDLKCWIITEGMAGTENQCIGIAQSLGIEPEIKRIKLKSPWKQLAPHLNFMSKYCLAEGSDDLSEPYPDLIIASGRKAVTPALYIKRASKGKTFVVQVQDPRCNPKKFDLVTLPQHDPTRGDNVVVTTGALHKLTNEKLEEAKKEFEKEIEHLPRPRVAVLIGGSSKHHRMTKEITDKLSEQLMGLKDVGLMITASRRTGEENTKLLRDKLKGEHIYFWDNQGYNPYFAYMALADYIIVTEDSVSMASEAIFTGKPVYVIPLEGGARRNDLFHKLLREQGYTRPFTGELEMWSYDTPNDTKIVADAIKKRLERREE